MKIARCIVMSIFGGPAGFIVDRVLSKQEEAMIAMVQVQKNQADKIKQVNDNFETAMKWLKANGEMVDDSEPAEAEPEKEPEAGEKNQKKGRRVRVEVSK